MKDIYVMGVNTSNHDRSAALLKNGEIICAIAEERIDRRKHSDGFYNVLSNEIVMPPLAAINYCLEFAKIQIDDVELFVCGRSIKSCRNDVLRYIPVKDKNKIIEVPIPSHHLAHAYSAYCASDFESGITVVIDEQGHWIGDKFEKISIYESKNREIKEKRKFYGDYYDVSLGMFYDFFSILVGFSDGMLPAAGKLMGLSSYGIHEQEGEIQLIDLLEDGNIRVNISNLMSYLKENQIIDETYSIDYAKNGPKGYGTILNEIAKITTQLDWRSDLGQKVAYKAQVELEKAVLHIVSYAMKNANTNNICLAGGIFLNSIINNRILELPSVEQMFIQPAATDDGTAIGYAYMGYVNNLHKNDYKGIKDVYFGKQYSDIEIAKELKDWEVEYRYSENICAEVANYIAANKIVCWFQGRSEFGPRALGNRSILANPAGMYVKDYLNQKVKRRENFRPFAPVVLRENVNDYFEMNADSPYMLLVTRVKSDKFPAITHVDNTARVQTVTLESNKLIYSLLKEVEVRTGIPMLLNTSFNINGEPLVETPYDAIRSFLLCDADILVIGNFIIDKSYIDEERIIQLRKMLMEKEPYNLYKTGMILYNKNLPENAYLYFNELCNSSAYNDLSKKQLLELHLRMAEIYFDRQCYELAEHYIEKIIKSLKLDVSLVEIMQMNCLVKSQIGKESEARRLFMDLQEIVSEKDESFCKKVIYGIIS